MLAFHQVMSSDIAYRNSPHYCPSLESIESEAEFLVCHCVLLDMKDALEVVLLALRGTHYVTGVLQLGTAQDQASSDSASASWKLFGAFKLSKLVE